MEAVGKLEGCDVMDTSEIKGVLEGRRGQILLSD